MGHERPQFRVVEGIDGGIVIVANAKMRDLLVTLLEDLSDRSVTETALMHELREIAQSPKRRGTRADENA